MNRERQTQESQALFSARQQARERLQGLLASRSNRVRAGCDWRRAIDPLEIRREVAVLRLIQGRLRQLAVAD